MAEGEIGIMKSFSEAGQDLFVHSRISRTRGTFLDIGCNDPFWHSNSYALELLGWDGILIDNDPEMIARCRKERPCSLAIEADAHSFDWSVIPPYTRHLDYLSLDTRPEDHPQILCNMIEHGLTFNIMTIEHDLYSIGPHVRDEIRTLLRSDGYRLEVPDVCVSGQPYEDWWVRP